MSNDYDPDFKPQKTFFLVGGKILISNSVGKVLLLLRSEKTTASGYWSLPGGALEKGESAYESIEREVLEETSLGVFSVKTFAVQTYYLNQKPTIIIGYTGVIKNDQLKLNWEHDDYKWENLEETHNYKLTMGAKYFLKEYIKINKYKMKEII